MTDTRSSSALFKRAEQLKRWEESLTNQQSPTPKAASRIQFSSGIVFLAACTAGDKEEVSRLLKMGADINTANVDGLTALHQAAIDDNLEMVEYLVGRGADVNRGDNEGWTPLHATASCGFVSIARFLLENGGDVAAVNYDGELPVDIAESSSMEDLLQKVIEEKGIDCEKSRNAEVTTLLSDARNWAANGYVEVRDPKTGGTPLHVAAAKGYIDVEKMLLEECGADPDSMDHEGWTPLHAAALWGQKEAAALLLKYGADPHATNYSGQTCLDLADQSISQWLAEAAMKVPKRIKNNNNNNNNTSIIRTPPRHDAKRPAAPETQTNDKPPPAPEIIAKAPEGKPPKGRAPSPEAAELTEATGDEPPSWRRTTSFRRIQSDPSRDNKPPPANNNTPDNDTILRRTHSFENDRIFYQRYRDVTARIKATSCPSIPPPQPPPADRKQDATNTSEGATNEDVQTRISPPERRDREANTWGSPTNANANTTSQTTVRSSDSAESTNSSPSTPSATTPTKLSPGNIFKNFFNGPTHIGPGWKRSFVPPVRDEESETQRKAHAKRARETRRSTQGVTLDDIKSAEQFVKKKTGNGTAEAPPPTALNKDDEIINSACLSALGAAAATAIAPAAAATAAASVTSSGERRPSWRLRLDPSNKTQFELEDAGRASPRPPVADTTVTLSLRRPPAASTANTAAPAAAATAAVADERGEEEKEREGSADSKSGGSPASTQAAHNVIQRRRRPKRRSTGVGHVDMDDIVNDRGGGGTEGEGDTDTAQSGSERTSEARAESPPDYKALYEASAAEVQHLRALLAGSEGNLREARRRLVQVNQNATITDIEKREKRAMERKLSEMEEELKQLQKLKAENERLRAENRALTRVVSKLTNSAGK